MPLGKASRVRVRASVACMACRARRIKCEMAQGESSCRNCKRKSIQCVIRDDDERKQPVCKAYIKLLNSRVELLETLLRQKGEAVPEASQIPLDMAPELDNSVSSPNVTENTHKADPVSPQSQTSTQGRESSTEQPRNSRGIGQPGDEQASISGSQYSQPCSVTSSRPSGLLDHILSSHKANKRSKLSRGVKYNGSTRNIHAYAHLAHADAPEESWQQRNGTARAMRNLSQATHDYLLGLFWENYNSTIHVVHEEYFLRDKDHGGDHYSGFLHICLLAVGYRFADKSRPDIKQLVLGNRESTLHREARYILEYELERAADQCTIQSLLILSDLECGVGRDNTGWMYTDLACRFAFDLGLDRDCHRLHMTGTDVHIRHMIFAACLLYDQYWALWLGRRTSIKISDLDPAQLADQRATLLTLLPSGAERALQTQIYIALLELMQHTYQIIESICIISDNEDTGAYLLMAALDQKLRKWHRSLPQHILWNLDSASTAPISYLLLHQQFYTLMIMVHRPFAWIDSSDVRVGDAKSRCGSHVEDEVYELFSRSSQSACTDNATKIANICQLISTRFDIGQMLTGVMHHAGTAAMSLIAATVSTEDTFTRMSQLRHLEALVQLLRGLSVSFAPAEQMINVLENIGQDIGWMPDYLNNLDMNDLSQFNFVLQEVDRCIPGQFPASLEYNDGGHEMAIFQTPICNTSNTTRAVKDAVPDHGLDDVRWIDEAELGHVHDLPSQPTPVSLDDEMPALEKLSNQDLGELRNLDLL